METVKSPGSMDCSAQCRLYIYPFVQVKSSKEGSLNTLDDAPTPPTPSSGTSDSTESSKPSQTGANSNSSPDDAANTIPSTNGMIKLR